MSGDRKKPKAQSTIDPRAFALTEQNYQRTQGIANTPFRPYSGPMAPPVPQATTDAISTAGRVSNFTPGQISPTKVGSTANVTAPTAASGMSQYQNPWLDQVYNAGLSDLDRARQITQVGNSQASTLQGGGAFGGSRLGVAEAETNRGFLDAAARLSANLRAQGFDTAAQLGSADATRALAASQGNQQTGLSRALANAQLGQQANLANQSAGLAGAGINLSGAQTLGNLGTQQFGMEDTGIQRAYAEYLRQQQDPFAKQQLINQSLGLFPAMSGTQTFTQQRTPFLDMLTAGVGGLAQGAGFGLMGMLSDPMRGVPMSVPVTPRVY